MLGAALLTAALAGTGPPTLHPVTAADGVVAVGVGLETWAGDDAAEVLQGRWGLGVRGASGGAVRWAQLRGVAEWRGTGLGGDGHRAELGVRRGPAGLALAGMGSSTGGWGEAALMGMVGSGRHAELRVGPALRLGLDDLAYGVAAASRLTGRPHPRLELGLLGEARGLQGEDTTLWGYVGGLVAWSPDPATTLFLVLDGQASALASDPPPGLPPPGLPVGRLLAGVESRASGTLALGLDASWEAFGRAQRFTVLAGLRWRPARLDLPDAPLLVAGEVPFHLHAPEATSVAVAGSFNQWRPAPLTRQRDGTWTGSLGLDPGEHTYVFLVDGEPLAPASCAHRRTDRFGGQSCVIQVE